jgi:protein gp37
MGKHTKISWATSTFNAWWGCVEVAPECDKCYAREQAERYGFKIWGKDAPRRFFPAKHWNQLFIWDREAAVQKTPWRVFWNSMSDLLEDREDLSVVRELAWQFQERTPNLTHMLLTKRPQNYERLWLKGRAPLPNQWYGATVGCRESEWRALELVKVKGAAVRWISAEPLLEATQVFSELDWYVFGAESGYGCREMPLDAVRAMMDACSIAGITRFVKQLGGFPDKRDDISKFPADLQVQEFPTPRVTLPVPSLALPDRLFVIKS